MESQLNELAITALPQDDDNSTRHTKFNYTRLHSDEAAHDWLAHSKSIASPTHTV